MGGKSSGGDTYQGPSATELYQQEQMYRQQWESEQALEEQEEILQEEKDEALKAQYELESRRGVKDILANQQRGFTKKSLESEDDDFLGTV